MTDPADPTPRPSLAEIVARRAAALAPPGEVGHRLPPPRSAQTSSRPPAGWEPAVTYGPDGRAQTITSGALPPSPELPPEVAEQAALAETLRLLGALVPAGYWARLAEVRLDEGAWHRLVGEDGTGQGEAYSAPCRRYRWLIEPESTRLGGSVATIGESEWQDLLASSRDLVYPALGESVTGAAENLHAPLGDLQSGQHDGDGVDGLIERAQRYPALVLAELARLRSCGTEIDRITIPLLGDLIENVLGFYSNQGWLVSLNLRDQVKVARRLIRAAIEGVASGCDLPIEVPCVPGNHGEKRGSGGKMLTDPADNLDLEIGEQVAEIISANPGLRDRVTFRFPQGNDLALALDNGFGYTVGYAHGHTGTAGTLPGAKQVRYLERQSMARTPLGDVDVYVTGHYHSAQVSTMPGGRTWVQIPALCDESEHFSTWYGLNGGPALTTFTLGPDGVDHYRTHRMPTLRDHEPEVR